MHVLLLGLAVGLQTCQAGQGVLFFNLQQKVQPVQIFAAQAGYDYSLFSQQLKQISYIYELHSPVLGARGCKGSKSDGCRWHAVAAAEQWCCQGGKRHEWFITF